MNIEVLYVCKCGFHKWRLRKKGSRYSKTSEAYCPNEKRYTTFDKCVPTQTRELKNLGKSNVLTAI